MAVAGTGGFIVSAGNLTFGTSVASTQTVDISGFVGVADQGKVTVEDPARFQALVNLHAGAGEIDLIGLAQADSYTYQRDMLTIYSGNKIIDTLRLTDQTQYGFDVVKTSGSVDVVALTGAGETLPGALPHHAVAWG